MGGMASGLGWIVLILLTLGQCWCGGPIYFSCPCGRCLHTVFSTRWSGGAAVGGDWRLLRKAKCHRLCGAVARLLQAVCAIAMGPGRSLWIRVVLVICQNTIGITGQLLDPNSHGRDCLRRVFSNWVRKSCMCAPPVLPGVFTAIGFGCNRAHVQHHRVGTGSADRPAFVR